MTGRADTRTEMAAYRIIQESLTNIARYAETDEAAVAVEANGDRLYLEIADWGKGFDRAAVRAAARTAGISGMVERAALLGGELTVHSSPGEGTRVTAQLPLGARPPNA